MAGFKLDEFRGVRPRLKKHLLSQGEAQTASDVKLGSGSLEPWLDPSSVQISDPNLPVTLETIYRYESAGTVTWCEWNSDVDVARSPIQGDDGDRIYYTGAYDSKTAKGTAKPKMATATMVETAATEAPPGDERILGMIAPTNAPALSMGAISERGTVPTVGGILAASLELSIEYNVYPGTATSDQLKFIHPSASSNAEWREFAGPAVGTELEVTVVNSNSITVKNLDGSGFIARTAEFLTGVWEHNNATPRSTLTAGVFHIPDGVTLTIPNHGLFDDDVLIVSEFDDSVVVNTIPSLTFTHGDLIEGASSFGTVSSQAEGTTTRYSHQRQTVTLPASANFTIAGGFDYRVERRSGLVPRGIEARAYQYTWVSVNGEESAPSPSSAIVNTIDEHPVTIDTFDTSPSNNDADELRIYRTNTGLDSTEWQLVAAVAIATTTYNDTVKNNLLGSLLESQAYDPPPVDMINMTNMPNGILVGSVGDTLHFSEPYKPHAWPPEYQIPIGYDIVGLAPFSGGIVVCTTGNPYVVSGAHPRSMASRNVDFPQPCVAKKGIATVQDTVIYPSPDGLVAAGTGGFSLITEGHYTKREWQALVPSSIVAGVLDGRYYGFYDTGAVQDAIVFHPSDPLIGLTTLTLGATVLTTDLISDSLYYVSGLSIYKWEGATTDATPYTWKSSSMLAPYPMNPAYAIVEAESYDLITFKLYADGNLKLTYTVLSNEPFRLPSGYVATHFEIELTSTDVITQVQIGETIEDIKRG